MPLPIRRDLPHLSHWTVHTDFAAFCRCTNNAKLTVVTALFEGGSHVMWPEYFAQLGKCKSLEIWRSRIQAAGINPDAAHACRTVNDCGRLLALKFICDKEGDPVDAGRLPNANFVGRTTIQYMAA